LAVVLTTLVTARRFRGRCWGLGVALLLVCCWAVVPAGEEFSLVVDAAIAGVGRAAGAGRRPGRVADPVAGGRGRARRRAQPNDLQKSINLALGSSLAPSA